MLNNSITVIQMGGSEIIAGGHVSALAPAVAFLYAVLCYQSSFPYNATQHNIQIIWFDMDLPLSSA